MTELAVEERERLYSAYLDDELGDAESLELLETLEQRPEWRAEFERVERTVNRLRGTPSVKAPTGFTQAVMRRVRHRNRRQRAMDLFGLPGALGAEVTISILLAAAVAAVLLFLGH